MVKSNDVVLLKMLEEIEYLIDFSKSLTHEEFMASEGQKRIASMTLINIGELVRHLSKDFRNKNKHLYFDSAIKMRDISSW